MKPVFPSQIDKRDGPKEIVAGLIQQGGGGGFVVG